MHIAVIATEGLRLEAFLAAFEQSVLAEADAELSLFSASNSDQSAVIGVKTLAFTHLDDADFSDVNLCVVLENAMVVEAYQAQLSQLECPLLGFSADVAVLGAKPVAEFSVESACAAYALYNPLALVLEHALSGLDIESLDVTAYYPVSVYGKQGIEELASQTAKLLNAQTVEPAVFHTQMTFNYFPMASTAAGRLLDSQLLADLRKLYSDVDVTARGIQMPVFHGVGFSVNIELADELDAGAVSEKLALNEQVHLLAADESFSNYAFVQHENAISVANICADADNSYRFELNLGVDDIKFACGFKMIESAEKLLKSYL